MIELLIAALIQIGTITTGPTQGTVTTTAAPVTEQPSGGAPNVDGDGGTGAWDDNN